MTDESASVTAARQLVQDARAAGRWRPPVLRRRQYRLRPLLTRTRASGATEAPLVGAAILRPRVAT